MQERVTALWSQLRLRQVMIGGGSLLCLLLGFSLLPPLEEPTQPPKSETFTSTAYGSDSALLDSLATLANTAEDYLNNAGQHGRYALWAVVNGVHGFSGTVINGVGLVANTSVRTLNSGVLLTGQLIGNQYAATVTTPTVVMNAAAKNVSVGNLLTPIDDTALPVINPAVSVAETPAPAPATVVPTPTIAPQVDDAPQWPLNGQITTLFGVPHRPFQDKHTGMDISTGQRRGTAEIKPFKPGIVTEAIYSSKGLGNHVIVDHGNGLTSTYAHLNSINVQSGQPVTKTTVLGYEGTTGVSTGPHLHLEIRVNGVPTDPLQHIPGRP